MVVLQYAFGFAARGAGVSRLIREDIFTRLIIR